MYWMTLVSGGAISAAFAHASAVTFEVLNRSLVRLGFFAGSVSPKIAPFASLGILRA